MPEPLRVLVTRESPGRLGEALARMGCEVIHVPLEELFPTGAPPPTPKPGKDGVVVTSASVCRLAPEAIGWMRDARVVAVGGATAASLRQVGLTVHEVAAGTGASALGFFSPQECPTFIGAVRPAPSMRAAVVEGRVTHWGVYDRRRRPVTTLPEVDVVTLTSPGAAVAWAQCPDVRAIPCVVLGPTTRAAALGAGLPVVAMAAEASMSALALAVVSGRWRA